MKLTQEGFMKSIFFMSALFSVLAVAVISIFLLLNGLPAIFEIGIKEFLLGMNWSPADEDPSFGIFPIIVGSIYITLGAIITGVPIGILTAVFIAYYCPNKLYKILKPAVELLAGIPSVVYGFFGLVLLVPLVRELFGGNGSSVLTASILLGLMILPTIIGVSEAAIRAVPQHYYEGALALGASKERSIFRAVLPAAKSGIMAAVILGLGRAVGETMAVIMVAGNQARLSFDVLKGVRTLTGNIVLEMGYAADLHREALIATGVVLFMFIMIINLIFAFLKRRAARC